MLKIVGLDTFCLLSIFSTHLEFLQIMEKLNYSISLLGLALPSPSKDCFLNAIHCKEEEMKILNKRHTTTSDSIKLAMSYVLEGDFHLPLKLASSLRRSYDYPYNAIKATIKELNKTSNRDENIRRHFISNHNCNSGSLIVDIKRRSLSRIGETFANFEDAGIVAESFISLGADVVFINVDNQFYGGDLKELKSAVRSVRKISNTAAIVMKDIVVNEIQLGLAKEANVDGILLIASVLGSSLTKFLDLATSIGLETIVECHTPDEVKVAIDALAQNILVSNYDRFHQRYYPNQAYNLAAMFPGYGGPIICLAGGGIDSTKEVKRLLSVGYDGIVLGKAVMGNNRVSEFIKILKYNNYLTSELDYI